MLYQYSIFKHDKSSSTSQFIKGKSRYLQKLTTALKIGTDACACWLRSPSSPGSRGQSVVFPVIQMIYLVKHCHEHHQSHLYNNFTNFLTS